MSSTAVVVWLWNVPCRLMCLNISILVALLGRLWNLLELEHFWRKGLCFSPTPWSLSGSWLPMKCDQMTTSSIMPSPPRWNRSLTVSCRKPFFPELVLVAKAAKKLMQQHFRHGGHSMDICWISTHCLKQAKMLITKQDHDEGHDMMQVSMPEVG